VKILRGRVARGTGVRLDPGSLNIVLDEQYRLPAALADGDCVTIEIDE
jgi:hypothetical protein